MISWKGLKYKSKVHDLTEYKRCIEDLLVNESVQMMKQFKHHFQTTCFEHAMNVSFYSYQICKYLELDYISAARGGLLHDLFLYDWRTTKLINGRHAFRHPSIALQNAKQVFSLNRIEQDIIEKHMWPLTIKFPKYKESFVVSFIDKFCTSMEIVRKDRMGQ